MAKKLSELIKDLLAVQKANGTYDPVARIMNPKGQSSGIEFVGCLGDYVMIAAAKDEDKVCPRCKRGSARTCDCDK